MRDEIAPVDLKTLLRAANYACANGKLEVVDWLSREFGVAPVLEIALRIARASGVPCLQRLAASGNFVLSQETLENVLLEKARNKEAELLSFILRDLNFKPYPDLTKEAMGRALYVFGTNESVPLDAALVIAEALDLKLSDLDPQLVTRIHDMFTEKESPVSYRDLGVVNRFVDHFGLTEGFFSREEIPAIGRRSAFSFERSSEKKGDHVRSDISSALPHLRSLTTGPLARSESLPRLNASGFVWRGPPEARAVPNKLNNERFFFTKVNQRDMAVANLNAKNLPVEINGDAQKTSKSPGVESLAKQNFLSRFRFAESSRALSLSRFRFAGRSRAAGLREKAADSQSEGEALLGECKTGLAESAAYDARARDYTVVIDCGSFSRAEGPLRSKQWPKAEIAVRRLAPVVCKYAPNGAKLIVFSGPGQMLRFEHIKDPRGFMLILGDLAPRGSADLAGALNFAFAEHDWAHRTPETYIVITAGGSDEKEAAKAIRHAVQRASGPRELCVFYVWVGASAAGSLPGKLGSEPGMRDAMFVIEMPRPTRKELSARTNIPRLDLFY